MAEAGVSVAPSEQSAVRPVETPAPHRSKTDQVADILRGVEQAPAEQAPETEAAPPADQPAEKWDLASVAEKLQVDPAKLYDLKVRTGDGAELSVGELKDAFKASKELDAVRETVTKERGELAADRIRAERELQSLLAAIPQDAVRPELAEQVRKLNAERLSREKEALFRTIPEWTDSGVLTADRQLMAKHLQTYGITDADLESVSDHRLLRIFRDYAKLAASVKADAKPATPKVASKPQRSAPASPAMEHGRLKAAVTTGRISKVEAVREILKRG